MSKAPVHSRHERFEEFLRRLASAAPATSFDEAHKVLCDTLNAVEDELSGIPFDPINWQADGRLYPPGLDSMRTVAGHPRVKRLRSRAHNTFIAANGAIEIQEVLGATVLFSKAGADGKGVW